jgi:hypothetical protein
VNIVIITGIPDLNAKNSLEIQQPLIEIQTLILGFCITIILIAFIIAYYRNTNFLPIKFCHVLFYSLQERIK